AGEGASYWVCNRRRRAGAGSGRDGGSGQQSFGLRRRRAQSERARNSIGPQKETRIGPEALPVGKPRLATSRRIDAAYAHPAQVQGRILSGASGGAVVMSTAHQVTPSGTWMVLAKAQQIVLDARRSTATSSRQPILGAANVR